MRLVARHYLYLIIFTAIFASITVALSSVEASTSNTAVEEIRKRLLVVYNENATDARELAFSYASARQLDRSQILSIKCSTDEEITRETFNTEIRNPIRKFMQEEGLLELTKARVNFGTQVKEVYAAKKNDIRAIVLIRGIPLRIRNSVELTAPEKMPPQFRKNEAAVDSELALITFDRLELNGFIPNPYYTANALSPFTEQLARTMVLVSRLDGPSSEDVKRMIRDSIATEKLELTGRAYFDARGITDKNSGYLVGDEWIRGASQLAQNAGLEVYLDDEAPILSSKLPVEDISLYAGWYTGDFKGPFERPDFKFRPGAIAYHLHSYSASTIRSTSKHWVGPMISKGATATMGSVYEPYLHLTPNVNTFFNSLLSGQCFAEAAYQSQSGLSWMVTMVGDPLYRPFPRSAIDSAQIAQSTDSHNAVWLCLRIARKISQQNMSRDEKIERITRMVQALPDPITYEGLGHILNNLNASPELVIKAFRQAEQLSNSTTGKIRNGLSIADTYVRLGDTAKAMAEYERLLSSYPKPARNHDIPNLAITYATKSGWNTFSPELQAFLAPVGESTSQEAKPDNSTNTNTTMPVKARKDLIPKKPVLAPPKAGEAHKQPQYHNPNRLPTPSS